MFAARKTQPQQGLSAPGAVSGAPVMTYSLFRFEPCRSERYFPAGFPLPCTTRQLSEGTVPDAYFVFVIAFGMDETLPLFWLNVNPIGQKTGEKHQGFTLDPLLRGEAAQG